ncbi:MAG: hypothetical protein WAN05_26675, partial [Roseiarcus sp.]
VTRGRAGVFRKSRLIAEKTEFPVRRGRYAPKLGFPWILSSESRLFNELHGILAENFFARRFLAFATGMGASGRGHAKGQFCSWGELNLSSDFLQ